MLSFIMFGTAYTQKQTNLNTSHVIFYPHQVTTAPTMAQAFKYISCYLLSLGGAAGLGQTEI